MQHTIHMHVAFQESEVCFVACSFLALDLRHFKMRSNITQYVTICN